MLDQKGFVIPDWPAPNNVKALVSTRISFYNSGESPETLNGYEHFNLALHVNDQAQKVLRNREALAQYIGVSPSSISWLEQVHGTKVVNTEDHLNKLVDKPVKADASISSTRKQVCAIMTADCLPVLLSNIQRFDKDIKVIWCDTGYNTPDTYRHAINLIDV